MIRGLLIRWLSGAVLGLSVALASSGCGDSVALDPFGDMREDTIIFGTPTGADTYTPVGVLWAVGEYDDNTPFSRIVCTATLVAPAVVVSAAHCLDSNVLGAVAACTYYVSFSADVSAWLDSSTEPPEGAIAVSTITLHPDFRLEEMMRGVYGLGYNHDVALAFLTTEAQPIPAIVLEPDDSSVVAKGALTTIVGYGAILNGRCADTGAACGIRRFATAAILEVGDLEMQVGGSDLSPRKCHGDSGGPTFQMIDDGALPAERLVGVTSHAYDASGCTTGTVDTLVGSYRSWIESTLIAACAAQERIDCAGGGALARPQHSGTSPTEEEGCDCRAAKADNVAALALVTLFVRRRRFRL